MNTGMRLQTSRAELFAQWKQLRNALYSGLDDEHHEREMDLIHGAADQACFVAVAADEDLVGFIEASLRNIVDGCIGGPVGYIEGLYVRPDCRGRGIGRALVDCAVDWFRDSGCSEMATDSELEDGDAQSYWLGLGFEETWRVVQFRKTL